MELIFNKAILQNEALYIGKPVKKEIKWMRGDEEITAIIYVKPLSYQSAVGDLTAVANDGDVTAQRIAESVVDENGDTVFTAGDIDGTANPERGAISSSLTIALLNAIGEVNGLGKN